MRGDDERSEGFFSYVRLEMRIAADHPLGSIRELETHRATTLAWACAMVDVLSTFGFSVCFFCPRPPNGYGSPASAE